MTHRYPWDTGGDSVRTRLVEDESEQKFHLEFQGDNAVAEDYRELRRVDGSGGFGLTRELREVAFVSNAEALFLRNLTGINLMHGGKEHTEAFLKLIRSGDFSRLKTFDGQTTTRAVK